MLNSEGYLNIKCIIRSDALQILDFQCGDSHVYGAFHGAHVHDECHGASLDVFLVHDGCHGRGECHVLWQEPLHTLVRS